MPKSGATANGGFDFQKSPESCLGLLDYLQRVLEQVWERIFPMATQPPRNPLSQEAQSELRLRHVMGSNRPSPKAEQEQQKFKLAYMNYTSERYRRFVEAFRQISHPLKSLFEMQQLALPTTEGPELVFFDFAQNPIENTSSLKITESYKRFWGNLCSEIHKAAIDRGELPEGWSPGQATVVVYGDDVGYLERYPTFPIRSQEDLHKWLLILSQRILKPDRPAQRFAAVSEVLEISEEDCYHPSISDISRELLNCRRTLVNWDILGCPNWEDVPPDLRAAENRVLTVIEWLMERHKPKSPVGESKVKTRPNKHDETRDQRNRFSCPRRAKDPPETWQEIYEAYSEKYPSDRKASPATLRQSHDRNCPQCADDRVR